MKDYKQLITPANITAVMTILIIGIIFSILCIYSFKTQKKLNKITANATRLEYNLAQLQKNWLSFTDITSSQLKSSTDYLEQKFNELTDTVGHVEATEPGYQLRAILRLTSLAAMQLTLNKEEPFAKELLKQAISKLIKINDPRLAPVLYNLQDQYSYLLLENTNKNTLTTTTQELCQRIANIQSLLEKSKNLNFADANLADSSKVELNDLFPDAKLNNNLNNNLDNKLNNIELIIIYLEQAKLAFLQNNEFLYKQAVSAVNNSLKLITWAPESILEIQEHLRWLTSIEIKNYNLLLQAILNLEDLL